MSKTIDLGYGFSTCPECAQVSLYRTGICDVCGYDDNPPVLSVDDYHSLSIVEKPEISSVDWWMRRLDLSGNRKE